MKIAYLLLLAGMSQALYAQTNNYPGLPPTDQVVAALQATPSVAEARAGMARGEAEGSLLRRGDYEFHLATALNQRRVTDNGQRYNEWSVGIERPLRLPGKGRLDAELGKQAVVVADENYGETMHEAARLLLARWFAWQRARQQVALLSQQTAALENIRAAVEKRVHVGDASALDLAQAQAALSTVEAAVTRARSDEILRRTELEQHYPALQLPTNMVWPDPPAAIGSIASWRALMLAHNHELALARAQSEQARLSLRRSEADRVPDPTVGLNYTSERGGVERLMGLSLSLPLPGAQRGYRVDRALAENRMASERERAVLVRLETRARMDFEEAQGSFATWQAAQQAADSQHAQARKLARAQILGEAGLAEVLMARRLYLETALSAEQARSEAWEAHYRLLLDAHQLWPFHAEGDQH